MTFTAHNELHSIQKRCNLGSSMMSLSTESIQFLLKFGEILLPAMKYIDEWINVAFVCDTGNERFIDPNESECHAEQRLYNGFVRSPMKFNQKNSNHCPNSEDNSAIVCWHNNHFDENIFFLFILFIHLIFIPLSFVVRKKQKLFSFQSTGWQYISSTACVHQLFPPFLRFIVNKLIMFEQARERGNMPRRKYEKCIARRERKSSNVEELPKAYKGSAAEYDMTKKRRKRGEQRKVTSHFDVENGIKYSSFAVSLPLRKCERTRK